MRRRHPRFTLFPYTTLFRSDRAADRRRAWRRGRAGGGLRQDRGQPAPPHRQPHGRAGHAPQDRKSTRLNSSHGYISYAVFCLKKKKDWYMLIDTLTLADDRL